jgi:hypothetical protein
MISSPAPKPMSMSSIKELIYGQEKRIITAATTFKSSVIRKGTRPGTYTNVYSPN